MVPPLSTLAVDERVATAAAGIRASTGIRTPDALRVACAMVADCDALLTNDRRLKSVTQIEVLVLDDFLAP